MIAGDGPAALLYGRMVKRLADRYQGPSGIFTDARWLTAEAEVEAAFQSKNSKRFHAAIAEFERAGVALMGHDG